MKPRNLLAMFLLPMGLIIAAVPKDRTKKIELSAGELLAEITLRTQYIDAESVADMIIRKDPSIRLIDVRSQEEFGKFSLEGALNIPLTDLLSDEYTDILDQDQKMNIFYSNSTLAANEAWMITRQLGYNNNFVLEGGLNYWFDVIMNPQKPASTSAEEEFAKYDFRRSASRALGGGAALQSTNGEQPVAISKPSVRPAAKKKRAAGGC